MGVALETVTVQPQPNARPRQERISRFVKVAIEHMVEHALSRPDAAKAAGITDHALYCAMQKPHVIAYRNELLRVLRSSEASRTIARAAKLADGADSEHVKLQANTWLHEIENGKPTQRTENTHIHKGVLPGLQVVFMGSEAPQVNARMIGGQAHEVGSSNEISALPSPVPHPALRNDRKEAGFAGESGGPNAAPAGKKRAPKKAVGT
jgi:hypothetical protein